MKRLIKIYLMAVLIMALSSCSSEPSNCPQQVINCPQQVIHLSDKTYKIFVIDGCEYVKVAGMYGISHKGNCKFCEERRRKENKH